MAAPSVFFWQAPRNGPYTPYPRRCGAGALPIDVRARLGDLRIFTHTKPRSGGQNSGLIDRVPARHSGDRFQG